MTYAALNRLRDEFAGHPAVATIELLNEPFSYNLDMDKVREFYRQGVMNLKDTNLAVTFHDAFTGPSSWNDWGNDLDNLLLDTHHYEIFDTTTVTWTIDQHINNTCNFGKEMAKSNKWTVNGEFTSAITDCTEFLNGRNRGARYDGTFYSNGKPVNYTDTCDRKRFGQVSGLNATEKANAARFIQAQLEAYELKNGWIFWTWKTESSPEWDMQHLLEADIFPNPVTKRNRKSSHTNVASSHLANQNLTVPSQCNY
jgi:glucan 1,3-beta-glucosidase